MDVKSPCPHCDNIIEYPEAMLGQTLHCPHCGNHITLSDSRSRPTDTQISPTGNSSRFYGIAIAMVVFGLLCCIDWSGDEAFRRKMMGLSRDIYGSTSREVERDRAELDGLESGRRFRTIFCFGVAAVFFLAGTIATSKKQ